MLYIILIFIISLVITTIDSTLLMSVFEVMLSAYFTLIYEKMSCMKNKSRGVSSYMCVVTNVINDIKNIKVVYR